MIRLLRTVAVALLAAATLQVTAATAHAGALDATCAGTQTVTYSPGLTLVPTAQSVHVQTSYAPCVSLSHPEVISGTFSSTRTTTLSCLTLNQAGSAVAVITWNTGQTSTFTYDRAVTSVGGNTVVTNTGAITAGLFAGDAAVEIIVGPSADLLQCLSPPGITSRAGVVTLEITSL